MATFRGGAGGGGTHGATGNSRKFPLVFNAVKFYTAVSILLLFCLLFIFLSYPKLDCSCKDSKRRSVVFTLFASCVDNVLIGFAPLDRSIFQAGWATGRHPQHEDEKWARLRLLRDDVNKALELARGAKILGSSLEGQASPEHNLVLRASRVLFCGVCNAFGFCVRKPSFFWGGGV